MTATIEATELRERLTLREAASSSTVDQSRGIVRNVALLHVKGANRDYDLGAVREAVGKGFYSNLKIYADHITESEEHDRNGVRSFRDWIGVATNSRLDEAKGTVFGDVHVLRSSEDGRKFLEAASSPLFSSAIGMSHDATGQVEEVDGRPLVTRIDSVESADAVTRPATTTTLFESVNMSEKTREGVGRSCSVKGADGMSHKGIVTRGPMMEVEMEDGSTRVVPMEMLEMGGDEEKPEDAEAVEMDAEVSDDPAQEMDGDDEEHMDETQTKESLTVEERAELESLREAKRLRDSEDMVTEKTASLGKSVREAIRKKLSGRVVTADEVDAEVAHARAILEAIDAERPEPTANLTEAFITPRVEETHDNDDNAELIFGAFGVEVK